MSPLSPSETRSLLDSLGHYPKRKLGQNFLIDGNTVRKSLELSELSDADTIVEIGPGLGTLSQAILAEGARLFAVEKDKALAAHLRNSLSDAFPKFDLELNDALDRPLANLPSDTGTFKIIANLPYAISTPWMDAVLSGPLPVSMTLMLQKEAAQRYMANAGSKQFGSISIFLQSAYRIAGSHDVSASCFYPKPDVGSILLHVELHPHSYRFSNDGKQLIRELFQQRRKQISSLLKKSTRTLAAPWLAALDRLSIDPKSRPEQIDLDLWKKLDAR